MAGFKQDGDFTIAQRTAKPLFSQPIPGVYVDYVLTQPYTQFAANYTPPAPNTPHPEFPDFRFVSDSDRQPIAQGIVRWTRTWARVPAQHIEVSTASYQFIGFYGLYVSSGLSTAGTVTGRQRFVRNVLTKVQYDYFLIGTGGTYASNLLIPVIDATQYYAVAGTQLMTDFLWSNPPFTSDTVPSRTTYDSWVTADAATASSFSIVVEPSRVERWMGNIYRRETKYVKAI